MKKRVIIITSLILAVLTLVTAGLLVWFLKVVPERERKEELENFAAFLKQYYTDKTEAFAKENETLGEVDVAFIGDSLTDGYDLAEYYPGMSVINRGIGGDTTHGVYDRLEVSVIEPNPKAIVMMIGTNNLTDMFTDYEDILARLKAELPDTQVVILSIPPAAGDYADRNGLIAINNLKIQTLAEKYGYVYVDIFTHLYDYEVGEMRAEYTTDGIHFTPLGYEIITALVKPVLDKILE